MNHLKKNIEHILGNFSKINIYTYSDNDVDNIINNIPEFSWIVQQILDVIKDDTLSSNKMLNKLQHIKDKENNSVIDEQLAFKILEKKNDFLRMVHFLKKDQMGGSISSETFNTLFFPGTLIDELPFGEEILDMISILFDNLDVLVEFITPFVEDGMEFGLSIIMELVDFLLDFGEAIPGAGSAIAIVSMGTNILQPFIEFVGEQIIKLMIIYINSIPDILNFLLNLSRKNYNEAVEEFTEILPVTQKLYDYLEDNIPVINKYIAKNNNRLRNVLDKAEHYQDIMKGVIGKVVHFRDNLLKKRIKQI